ncbi:MAG TPA: peroxiredoxin, partial [Thermodesulfobacteriota bacterium]|nr:peroxiredoxin [Thermodesulfobacteriota bacterium]
MSDMPKVGDKAPEIEAETYGGEKLRLGDFIGKKTVALYFYPKDNTPGCTKEACSMRDGIGELQELGVQVLGVSTDSVKSHESFRDKYNLNFPLLSDKDKNIIKSYGVESDHGSAKRVTFL